MHIFVSEKIKRNLRGEAGERVEEEEGMEKEKEEEREEVEV